MMVYNTRSIIKDINGKPVPQYWNPNTKRFEVVEGNSGKLKVILTDGLGTEIVSQNLVDQINAKLDELIGVVK